MSAVSLTDRQNAAMTRELASRRPTNEDLLSKIRREMHERLDELRRAVDEHERLQADLRALDAELRPAAHVRRGSVGCEPQRTPTVSPKLARLMHAPRRPSLDRPSTTHASICEHPFPDEHLAVGIETTEADLFPGDDPILGIEEVDVEAMRYEQSL